MAYSTKNEFNNLEFSNEVSYDNYQDSSQSDRRRRPYALAPESGSKFKNAMETGGAVLDIADSTSGFINNINQNQPNETTDRSVTGRTEGTSHYAILSTKKLTIISGISFAVIVIIVVSIVTPIMIQNKQKTSNSEKSTIAQTGISYSNTRTSSLTTIILTSTTTTLVTTTCPNLFCSVNPSVQNPSLNYQAEHLDINCTQSLANLTIVQTVRRFNNETYAAQYQTFWNHTTNMTYIESPSDITYIWYMLPNMIINDTTFPHFIEAQYYNGGNSGRSTDDDTWHVSFQSMCGYILTSSGTF